MPITKYGGAHIAQAPYLGIHKFRVTKYGSVNIAQASYLGIHIAQAGATESRKESRVLATKTHISK